MKSNKGWAARVDRAFDRGYELGRQFGLASRAQTFIELPPGVITLPGPIRVGRYVRILGRKMPYPMSEVEK